MVPSIKAAPGAQEEQLVLPAAVQSPHSTSQATQVEESKKKPELQVHDPPVRVASVTQAWQLPLDPEVHWEQRA